MRVGHRLSGGKHMNCYYYIYAPPCLQSSSRWHGCFFCHAHLFSQQLLRGRLGWMSGWLKVTHVSFMAEMKFLNWVIAVLIWNSSSEVPTWHSETYQSTRGISWITFRADFQCWHSPSFSSLSPMLSASALLPFCSWETWKRKREHPSL